MPKIPNHALMNSLRKIYKDSDELGLKFDILTKFVDEFENIICNMFETQYLTMSDFIVALSEFLDIYVDAQLSVCELLANNNGHKENIEEYKKDMIEKFKKRIKEG